AVRAARVRDDVRARLRVPVHLGVNAVDVGVVQADVRHAAAAQHGAPQALVALQASDDRAIEHPERGVRAALLLDSHLLLRPGRRWAVNSGGEPLRERSWITVIGDLVLLSCPGICMPILRRIRHTGYGTPPTSLRR